MSFSSGDGLLLAGLLAAGLLLLSIAQFVRIPYPILLVLGGLALAFIPGVPHIQLRPEIVLVAVLPPLLYGSAYFTSLRELRANWRPIGALAIGLAVGFLIRMLRRRLDNPPVEITVALLSGYFAYLPAQAAGVSGVLAAVTVGVYMGWYTPELTTPQTRLQGRAVWEIVFVLLNGLLFALVGLQLPGILDSLSGRSTWTLLGWAALVCLVVIAARFVWVFALACVSLFAGKARSDDPAPSW